MRKTPNKACFFSHEPLKELNREQYSLQDIRILRELGYDVVIANSFSSIPHDARFIFSWWASGSVIALAKAALHRIPIIVVAGGNEAQLYYDSIDRQPAGYTAYPPWKRLLIRQVLRRADYLLAVSGFMIRDIEAISGRTPTVVYNSIDTTTFRRLDITKRYITTVFRHDVATVKLKRGIVFLDAMKFVCERFPELRILLIGSGGDARNEVIERCRKNNILQKVDFAEGIPNNEMPRLLCESKAYVQISDTETFGVAVAEAMSCETTVVVSARGAIPEIVGDRGIYVDHNCPDSVAQGIIDAITEGHQTRQDRGPTLRRRVIERFSYEQRKVAIERLLYEGNLSI